MPKFEAPVVRVSRPNLSRDAVSPFQFCTKSDGIILHQFSGKTLCTGVSNYCFEFLLWSTNWDRVCILV